jgi:Tfp pilus assembly protein FimT
MIELVVVIIIVAIFSATATVTYRYRIVDTDAANEIEILKSSIRYAQTKALNDAVDNNTWGLNFASDGKSYSLVYNGVTMQSVNLPGECGNIPMVCISTPTHNLPNGMTITGGAVSFNKWGSPADGSGNPLNNNIMITLTKSGQAVSSITVTKNTGSILIQ